MISVIICTYNRAQRLRHTLQSLAAMSIPTDLCWEVVVVDNNSSDETPSIVQEFCDSSGFDVKYLFEATQGLSHARNAGVRVARGEIVSFIDDDVTVDSHWLKEINDAFNRNDCIGVGGKVLPVWPCPKPSWLKERGRYRLMKAIVSFDLGETLRRIDASPFGANMSFRKMAFEKYGLFRTDLGRVGTSLISGEDTEFGKRLLRGDETLIYAPAAVVYHPVEEARIRKQYFQSWYFNYGRVLVRLDDIAGPQKCFVGIPAILLKRFLAAFLRWLVAFKPQKTFYYRLNMCMVLGQIVEIYSQRYTAAGHSQLKP